MIGHYQLSFQLIGRERPLVSINLKSLADPSTLISDIFLSHELAISEGEGFDLIILRTGFKMILESFASFTIAESLWLESDIESSESQGTIKFTCKYARLVETNKVFEAGTLEDADEITAMGELTYSMIVTPGNFGAMTNIKIVDDHGVDKIYPR